MTKRANTYREPGTGRYSYFGDFDRLCKCGHSLGVHIAGGYECGTDPTGGGEPESAGCKCERFRPSGKRKASAHPSTPRETAATQDEMENYRLALAWIKGQSTDPQAKEIAATALDSFTHPRPDGAGK